MKYLFWIGSFILLLLGKCELDNGGNWLPLALIGILAIGLGFLAERIENARTNR